MFISCFALQRSHPLGFGRAQLIYDEQKTNSFHAFIYEKINYPVSILICKFCFSYRLCPTRMRICHADEGSKQAVN